MFAVADNDLCVTHSELAEPPSAHAGATTTLYQRRGGFMPLRGERKRQYDRLRARSKRANWLAANGPCVWCGSWENLEVDHIDRTQKIDHNVWSWSEKRRAEELAKCQVLCHLCHKEKTRREFSWRTPDERRAHEAAEWRNKTARCMAWGQCVRCGFPKEETRMANTACESCAAKARAKQRKRSSSV